MRQRSRRACAPCRKRKVKCNGSYPCDICQGYGYECEFGTEIKKPTKRAQTEDSSPDNLVTPASSSNDVRPIKSARIDRPTVPREPSHDARSSMLVEVPNRKCLALMAAPFPESLISRYTTVYSAVAFPRDLGRSTVLASSGAPRLHAFAWNTGTRQERLPDLGNRIYDNISLQDTLYYADVFFSELHPIFSFFDKAHFEKACIAAWALRQMPIDLEAMACGVVALGSLFSSDPTPWDKETYVVDQAEHLLQISISSPPAQLALKFVCAWLLRAVYLRCTTRPHVSWMATCNAVHIAETIGIHQEFKYMDVLHERTREAALKEATCRRKCLWLSLSLNRLFSIEYGRTPLHLDSITCLPLVRGEVPDPAVDFVNLCQLLPTNRHDVESSTDEKESLTLALQHLADVTPSHPALVLMKTDICFSIFRKLRFLHADLTRPQMDIVFQIIQDGLHQSQALSRTRSKWWNTVSIPFHSVCVLVAINTTASLGLLVTAMEALKTVVTAYNTHLAREALQTAEQLVRGCYERKMEDTAWIGQALSVVNAKQEMNGEGKGDQAVPQIPPHFDWPSEDDGGWMEIFFNMGMEQ